MSKEAKRAYVSILGLVGLVVLLVGAILHVYPVTVGVIVAIVCWIGCGILAKYWGLKKAKGEKEKS